MTDKTKSPKIETNGEAPKNVGDPAVENASPTVEKAKPGVFKGGKLRGSDNWGEPGSYGHQNATMKITTN